MTPIVQLAFSIEAPEAERRRFRILNGGNILRQIRSSSWAATDACVERAFCCLELEAAPLLRVVRQATRTEVLLLARTAVLNDYGYCGETLTNFTTLAIGGLAGCCGWKRP